jgi:hypothetical protein
VGKREKEDEMKEGGGKRGGKKGKGLKETTEGMGIDIAF